MIFPIYEPPIVLRQAAFRRRYKINPLGAVHIPKPPVLPEVFDSSGYRERFKKWSIPLPDWKPAINQFMIMYQDRMPDFILRRFTQNFLHSHSVAIRQTGFQQMFAQTVSVFFADDAHLACLRVATLLDLMDDQFFPLRLKSPSRKRLFDDIKVFTAYLWHG